MKPDWADDIFGRPMRVVQGPMAHTPDQALPYPHYTNSYNAAGLRANTARWAERWLSEYHGRKVALRYIMAGTNRASGYAYYVYGYDYAAQPASPARAGGSRVGRGR